MRGDAISPGGSKLVHFWFIFLDRRIKVPKSWELGPFAGDVYDNGNVNNNDACSNLCKNPKCGDGVVGAGEECDDGNANNNDACDTQCVALRPNLMLCGGSQYDVKKFIPPGYAFNLVASCTPDVNTQALLVSRGWGNGVNAATLKTYLDNGGIVLTEWNISHLVWGLVFGAVAQGAGKGSCWDTAPTVVQFTPGDKMWQAIPFPLIPLAQSGCGYSTTHFPGMTPIAGWDAASVSIGYRDSLKGRFWVTDFDWQDNEPYDKTNTNKLMGYMITHRK